MTEAGSRIEELDLERLRTAIHTVVCDRPEGFAKHAAGHGVRCGLPDDSTTYPIAAEYARLAVPSDAPEKP